MAVFLTCPVLGRLRKRPDGISDILEDLRETLVSAPEVRPQLSLQMRNSQRGKPVLIASGTASPSRQEPES